MAFERVPAEILILCLREAHSPEDLGAAIRASPAFLQAFHCQEQAILTSVLQKCMSADALQQALLIVMCPVWENGDSKHLFHTWGDDVDSDLDEVDSTWADRMLRFRVDHHREAIRLPCNGYLSKHKLTAVCHLRAKVNYIIADYVAFTRCVSDIHGPEPVLFSPHKSELQTLTQQELGRLQNAFLRYELLCRCWGWSHFHSWLETLSQAFLGDFDCMNDLLDPWDREGIVIVHRYVMAKYMAMFQEIVQDFTTTVNAISEGNHESLSSPTLPSVRELLGEDGPKFLLEIGWRTMQPSTTETYSWRSLPEGWGQGYVSICVDNLSKLGLGFLLNMLKSGRQQRRDVIRDVFDVFCPREGSSFPRKASNFVWGAEEAIDELGIGSLNMMKSGGNSA